MINVTLCRHHHKHHQLFDKMNIWTNNTLKWIKKVLHGNVDLKKKLDKIPIEEIQLRPTEFTTDESPCVEERPKSYSYQLPVALDSPQYSTLNVPDSNEPLSSPNRLEYQTQLDDSSVTRLQQRSSCNSSSSRRNSSLNSNGDARAVGMNVGETVTTRSNSSRSSVTSTRNRFARNSRGIRYLGTYEYQGIGAYIVGNEGDAGFPADWLQVNIRIFNPNCVPPVWGNRVHHFLIGWDEKFSSLIDILLYKEDANWDDVRLEFFAYPGNVIRVDAAKSARTQGMRQNAILHLRHQFKKG